jgi:hypothetical protein
MSSSGRCVADSPIRCGAGAPSELLQALQAEREMRAPLAPRDRMDLVDDDVLDAAQDVACLAGQEQVEALGGRDQDVGRAPDEVPSILRGRIARPAGDRDRRDRETEPLGGQSDAGERGAEVPLDVVRQGLEWRDVEDSDPGARGPSRLRTPSPPVRSRRSTLRRRLR